MKKILTAVVIGIFVLSGLGAVSVTEDEIENLEFDTIIFQSH